MCWIVVSFIFHPEVTYFRSLSLILFIICLLIFTSDWLLWLSCPICRISNAYFLSILFSQWIAGKSSCKHFESRNQICVCVCMLYGKDTKYLKMITQKKSVSSVVSQNMNSIKTVLVGEMLLLAVCVILGSESEEGGWEKVQVISFSALSLLQSLPLWGCHWAEKSLFARN